MMLLLRLHGMWCIAIFRHAFGGICLACWTHHTLHMYLRISSSCFVLTEANKVEIVRQGAVGPLLGVARSHDPRVQRNATGALLNLTHIGKPPPSQSISISLSLSPPPPPSSPSFCPCCKEATLLDRACSVLGLFHYPQCTPNILCTWTAHVHTPYTMFPLLSVTSTTHQN